MYHGERFNSLSHLVGTLLAIAGAVVLILMAARLGDAWKIVSFSIFGATLILLYAASTLYHGSRGRVRDFFAKLDHCAIFLLIAGTYTPIALVTLHGAWGWSLLGVIWGLALLGIVRELWWARHAAPSVTLYAVMGWLGLVAIVPLTERLSAYGLLWLGIGAVLYTVGTVFYGLGERWRHSHGVWHLFVLGGSASHYYAVARFVA
ncbi:PAQR family membrane homeostasis protein [Chitinimonas naiadis]